MLLVTPLLLALTVHLAMSMIVMMELRKVFKTNVPGSLLYQKNKVNVDQNVPLMKL